VISEGGAAGALEGVPAAVTMVARSLREDIAHGRIRCGERIKEVPLATSMGVSRTSVRAAIRLIADEGLLRLHQNRGASVPLPALADVLEVYALRATLGSLALQRLMVSPERVQLEPLERILERFAQAVGAADQQTAVRADLDFQNELVAMSGLPRVQRTFEQLSNQIMMFISSLGVTYDLQSIYDDVAQLLEAVSSSNLLTADRLWRDKFERCMRDFFEYLPDSELDPALWIALTQSGRPGRYTQQTALADRSSSP
jgi:DNA-binding GntR family transcriptional regulator